MPAGCAGCGVAAAVPVPAPVLAAVPAVRGVTLVTWLRGEYGSEDALRALAEIQGLHANWVALAPTGYQDHAADARGPCHDPQRTPGFDELRRLIAQAHERGLKVLLKPHVDCLDGAWRGGIGRGMPAGARETWFRAYRVWLLGYVRLAAETGVEAFCVGTELAAVSWRLAEWRATIAAVRAEYGGTLTYAANWSGEEHVAFWDALDWIGVDAYYPVGGGPEPPSVEDLRRGWAPALRALDGLARRWRRPVVLTEVGYRSAAGAWREPWTWGDGAPPDPDVQGRLYEAAALALRDLPWLEGVFVWAWDVRPSGGPGDAGFTPRGKPAERVLRAAFGLAEAAGATRGE